MPNVQIKDVPSEVHAVLRHRAALAGKSLQEYLLGRLSDEASRPTLEEVLDSAGGRSGGAVGFVSATKVLNEERRHR